MSAVYGVGVVTVIVAAITSSNYFPVFWGRVSHLFMVSIEILVIASITAGLLIETKDVLIDLRLFTSCVFISLQFSLLINWLTATEKVQYCVYETEELQK